MRFCPDHWEKLQAAIDARGLGVLVAESGEDVASKLIRGSIEGTTVDTFEPLMGAHNAILARAMDEISGRYQQNPMMLLAPDDDPDVTWPLCPVCLLAWLHVQHNEFCKKPNCDYPIEFDWEHEMIDGAADHMLKTWQDLNA